MSDYFGMLNVLYGWIFILVVIIILICDYFFFKNCGSKYPRFRKLLKCFLVLSAILFAVILLSFLTFDMATVIVSIICLILITIISVLPWVLFLLYKLLSVICRKNIKH